MFGFAPAAKEDFIIVEPFECVTYWSWLAYMIAYDLSLFVTYYFNSLLFMVLDGISLATVEAAFAYVVPTFLSYGVAFYIPAVLLCFALFYRGHPTSPWSTPLDAFYSLTLGWFFF